jgi:hypothetical protein
MTLHVSLHRPTKCIASHFTSDGRDCASVTFRDDDGAEVGLFVTPAMADALAYAWDREMSRAEAALAVKEAAE